MKVQSLKRRRHKTRAELGKLATEQVNQAAADLDLKSSLEVARLMNSEDAKVAATVSRALPQIARAINLIASCSEAGRKADLRGRGNQRPNCGSGCG